jgi:hypothetical protein
MSSDEDFLQVLQPKGLWQRVSIKEFCLMDNPCPFEVGYILNSTPIQCELFSGKRMETDDGPIRWSVSIQIKNMECLQSLKLLEELVQQQKRECPKFLVKPPFDSKFLFRFVVHDEHVKVFREGSTRIGSFHPFELRKSPFSLHFRLFVNHANRVIGARVISVLIKNPLSIHYHLRSVHFLFSMNKRLYFLCLLKVLENEKTR